MPYNSLVSRTDIAALIPEQVSQELLTTLVDESAALRLFRRIPMSTHQTRMPVLAALPTAYFVAGDTGLKQTTEVAWSNKYLNVEEIAAIVPIPEAVLDDMQFSVWETVRPLLTQALGRVLDAAIFFGTNKPTSWPAAIITDATTVGNTQTQGTSAASIGGVAQDFNVLFGKIEADGFDINGIVAERKFRAVMRGIRDTTGQKLIDIGNNAIDGIGVNFAMPGLWPSGSGVAEVFCGDFTQGIVGLRQDVSFKLLDQAPITDNTGQIIYNLAQQDMIALRVTLRAAFQVANTINYQQPTEASRYPFGVMLTP